MEKYLGLTNSWLTIDQFTFDCSVLTNREYEANACYLKISDITGGAEIVPVSAVNCLDQTKPGMKILPYIHICIRTVPLINFFWL